MKFVAQFQRMGLALFPNGREGRELFAKIKDGGIVFVEVWMPRNMAQHRAYFGMLNNVVEASGQWPSREALEFDIALELKAGDIHIDRQGGQHFRPWSRRVASMKKDDFERLHRDTEDLLTKWLGCNPSALHEEAA
jgi:hypothetical protein